MSQSVKAMWMDMKFYTTKTIPEGRNHERYRLVVQACSLHASESGAGQKLCLDESRNLETIGARMWKKKSTTLELHRVNQVRLERKSLDEHGGE